MDLIILCFPKSLTLLSSLQPFTKLQLAKYLASTAGVGRFETRNCTKMHLLIHKGKCTYTQVKLLHFFPLSTTCLLTSIKGRKIKQIELTVGDQFLSSPATNNSSPLHARPQTTLWGMLSVALVPLLIQIKVQPALATYTIDQYQDAPGDGAM